MSEEERDMEQTVPRVLGIMRQMAARLDNAGFGGSAVRLIAKYRQTCGTNSPAGEVAALANDEAVIHFHQGDDSACLKALTGLTDAVPGTAFNRALCGGTCSLEPAKCARAAEARSRGLATRALQKKLREVTRTWCASQPIVEAGLPSWNLPSEPSWAVGPQGSRKLVWAGDINGDGFGDLIEAWEDQWKDMSSAALNGYALPSVRWKAFRVLVGCAKVGRFTEIMERNSDYDGDSYDNRPGVSDDKIAIRVLEQPGSTIRSVCVYPSRNLKCTASKCSRKADQCADLDEWEKLERSAKAAP